MKINLLQIPVLILLFFSCCKKKDPEPRPKHIPSNYMVAKVDGADWKACGPPPYTHISGQYRPGGSLKISGNKVCGDNDSGVYLELQEVKDTGTFILNTFHRAVFSGPELDSTRSLLLFSTTDTHTGKVVITKLDTILKEVSGRFQFEAYSAERNKVRIVSEGFFNKIRYY